MTLIEWSRNAPADRWVYLGSQSAYMWISTAGEMINKLPELDTINLKTFQHYQRSVEGHLDQARHVMLMAARRGKGVKDNIALIKHLEESVERNKRRVTEYKPLAEREILEVYKREVVRPFGDIVIVEGCEMGRYFTLDEIRSGRINSYVERYEV